MIADRTPLSEKPGRVFIYGPGGCTPDTLARTIAEVVGELDAENPTLLEPAKIDAALQVRGHLPPELASDYNHEAAVLRHIGLMRGYLSDSKRRTYQVRQKSTTSGKILVVCFKG